MAASAAAYLRASGLADPTALAKLAVVLIVINATGLLTVALHRWGAIAAVVAAG
jgi:hypothetical protein